ncbi:hypothetical protein [Erythrobacter sp. QSSC1-22B]|uniref:hypothetical protein n=1 Tax=Erythrobacter sp. QSSC1-22B TaxID=1860125 RepID=UPI0011A61EFF|nr:hypothetical protein [Erythrobacter sp. QSSC1-22B]
MLKFAQVEIALASNLDVKEEHREKFRARLKQLQRSGWPTGVNTGGKRPRYGARQLLELAFVLELLECGISPDRSVRLIEGWWESVRKAFLQARSAPDEQIMLGFFQTHFTGLSLQAGQADIGEPDEGAFIFSITANERPEELSSLQAMLSAPRYITINVSRILFGLTVGLREAGTESAFVWAQTEEW